MNSPASKTPLPPQAKEKTFIINFECCDLGNSKE
jgi:hypothetical protein